MNDDEIDRQEDELKKRADIVLDQLKIDLVNKLGEDEYNRLMEAAREESCFWYPQIPLGLID